MPKVLVVDDQPAVRTALEVLFDVHGIEAISVGTPAEAIDQVRTGDIAVVVQDMNFTEDTTSGEEGVRLFRALHRLDPELPVVLMTAWTSLETAVMLVKEGACDYVPKPWEDQKLVASVRSLLRLRSLEDENARLHRDSVRARRELAERADLCGLVYAAEATHRVVSLAVHVASADVPVLVTGPAGSGKEKFAEILQANSRRRDKPFVKVNAGALPDNLMEAELFGAEAGAFTGASKLRVGRFEAADSGTLFLDEVGNLSLPGQMKLLRVLQTGEFQRLGSSSTRKVDVRLISATNSRLEEAIAQKTFRDDLFFRLNVIELRVPPLAERRDDILPLAELFLEQGAKEAGQKRKTLGEQARRALLEYHWPGNVRELQNRMRRASLVGASDVLVPGDLDLAVVPRPATGSQAPARASGPGADREPDPDRALVEGALVRADGNVSKAAAELGLSRQALYRRMERLGVTLERRPRGA